MNNLLNTYLNGNCKVELYEDGTKVRFVKQGQSPLPVHPDNMDVKITNWCDADCSYCHESSNIKGKHGDLQPTLNLLTQLPAGVEVAIGGGHPLSHPEFDNFVKELTNKGLVCNVTINQKHFTNELNRLEALIADGHIKGVGYSYIDKSCDWRYDHLVSHIIIGTINQSELHKITRINDKILLLGFKDFRKGLIYRDNHNDSVESNIQSWYKKLGTTIKHCQVSFDNLAIEQLKPQRLFNKQGDFDSMFMGEEGQFSMYIDAVNQKISLASFEKSRHPYRQSIKDTFKQIQVTTNRA